MEERRHFSSPQEEVEHWKAQAREYRERMEEAKEELDEFQISSRELEAELEAQLEQQEKKCADFSAANQRLQMEVESLREKLESGQAASHKQTSELEGELAQVRAFKDELQKYIRELEQANDDLERAKRATVVSLEDFEARLNQAIERNAFLESELEERETLATTVQRLKDEARDLRSELAVNQVSKENAPKSPVEMKPLRIPDNEKSRPLMPADHVDSNKLAENEDQPKTPSNNPSTKSLYTHHSAVGTPLTPSARISALNIVGDLLRKVGALESKLASCRNFVKDQPRSNKTGSTSPLNSPRSDYVKSGSRSNRAKRLHRGTSAPVPPGAASKQGFGVKISV